MQSENQVSVQLVPAERESMRVRAEQAREVLEGFRDFTIDDDSDLAVATDYLKDVKRAYKEIEAKKEGVTKPMNAALREIRSWFQPALDVLSSTEALLKKKVYDYHQLQAERSRRAMEAAAAAAVAGNFDAAHEASKGILAQPASQGVSIGQSWDYDIEDFSQVPRSFLCVDHSAVRIHIKNSGKNEPAAIPGLRFFQKGSVTVRT